MKGIPIRGIFWASSSSSFFSSSKKVHFLVSSFAGYEATGIPGLEIPVWGGEPLSNRLREKLSNSTERSRISHCDGRIYLEGRACRYGAICTMEKSAHDVCKSRIRMSP